jgi:hypothetical protein
MKGGAATIPDNFQNIRVNEDGEFQSENNDTNILSRLGFEEGELEMFFDMTQGNISENQLIDKYLEIAQSEPYNLNWDHRQIALDSDYDTGVQKPNGANYTKHDIANDVLNSFYQRQGGKKRKTRKSRRKSRKSRRKTRKHRRNSRRR